MKTVRVFWFFILCIASFGTLRAEVPSRRSAVERIAARGKIVAVVAGEDNYPFLYRSRGAWKGIETEVLASLAEGLGQPWEVLVCGDAEACLRAVEEGRGDLLAGGLKKSVDEARFLAYSRSLMVSECLLLFDRLQAAKSKNEKIAADPMGMLADGKRPTLGVSKRGRTVPFLRRKYGLGNVRYYDTDKEAIDSLLAGRIPLCIVDGLDYRKYFEKDPKALLRFGAAPLEVRNDRCLAVHWRDGDFLRLVDQAFSQSETKRKRYER